MEDVNDQTYIPKVRHISVTVWLFLMIIANSVTGCIYFLFTIDMIQKNMTSKILFVMSILLGLLQVANVIFSVLLLKWKKLGFWGFIVSSLAALFITLVIGTEINQSVIGLVWVAMLYGILQIKKGNVSAWEQLE